MGKAIVCRRPPKVGELFFCLSEGAAERVCTEVKMLTEADVQAMGGRGYTPAIKIVAAVAHITLKAYQVWLGEVRAGIHAEGPGPLRGSTWYFGGCCRKVVGVVEMMDERNWRKIRADESARVVAETVDPPRWRVMDEPVEAVRPRLRYVDVTPSSTTGGTGNY